MARITLQRIAIAGLILLSSWPHSVVGREYPHPLFQSHSTAIEFALALPYEYENKCRLLTYSDRQKEFEKRNENVHAYGYLDEVKKTYEEAKRSFEWSGNGAESLSTLILLTESLCVS